MLARSASASLEPRVLCSLVMSSPGWLDGGTTIERLEGHPNDFVDSFEVAMNDLIDSVEQNRDPILAGRLGMRTTEIIMAAYESAARQAQVKLPLNNHAFPLLARPEFK